MKIKLPNLFVCILAVFIASCAGHENTPILTGDSSANHAKKPEPAKGENPVNENKPETTKKAGTPESAPARKADNNSGCNKFAGHWVEDPSDGFVRYWGLHSFTIRKISETIFRIEGYLANTKKPNDHSQEKTYYCECEDGILTVKGVPEVGEKIITINPDGSLVPDLDHTTHQFVFRKQ